MRMKIQVALWLALVFSSQRAPASPLVVTSGQAAQASAAEAELLQALEYGAQVSTPQDTVSINATLSSPSVSANAGNVFKAAILAALRQMSSGATAATTTTATFVLGAQTLPSGQDTISESIGGTYRLTELPLPAA